MTITGLLLQVEVSAFAESWESLLVVAGKFLLNLSVVILIIRLGYSRGKHKAEFIFTYFTFNVLIFFLCYLMTHVDLSIGFAFGLFALFSIMRYRTTTIEIREMTYLFVVVSLGVLNSVTGAATPIAEVLLINLAILLTVCVSERIYLKKPIHSVMIRYEKIEFLNRDKFPLLKAELEQRLGVEIINIEVLMLNYMTDSAELEVYFHPSGMDKPHPLKQDLINQTAPQNISEEVHF